MLEPPANQLIALTTALGAATRLHVPLTLTLTLPLTLTLSPVLHSGLLHRASPARMTHIATASKRADP